MKYFIFIAVIFFTGKAFAQESNINQYQHYFATDLNRWANTFKNFQLSEFQRKDSLSFDREQQDFRDINSFLSSLKPILTFNRDSSQFIDIYTDQANISKEGDHFVAYADDGGAVFLCNMKSKYRKRIFYNSGTSEWMEEAVWVSKTKFILVGISKNAKNDRMPLILVGDAIKQTLYEYISRNNSCIQKTSYSSVKLKRMDIRGM